MKLLHVVGTRPNFVKTAPAWRAAAKQVSLEQQLVHTGQHYVLDQKQLRSLRMIARLISIPTCEVIDGQVV